MAKFKVYYTIELNEVATHIFESNDFEVKLCSHNDEETYVKELAEFQPDATHVPHRAHHRQDDGHLQEPQGHRQAGRRPR